MFGDYYAWSQEYSFKSAPKAGADVTTTVISFGGSQLYSMRGDAQNSYRESVHAGSTFNTDWRCMFNSAHTVFL